MICAIVHPGYHNLLDGDSSFFYWEKQLDRLSGIPVVAHIKLTPDINDDSLKRGYDGFYREESSKDSGYKKLEWAADPKKLAAFKTAVDRKNKLLGRYCELRRRVLIDLDQILSPKNLSEISLRFIDLVNPREDQYEVIAEAIQRQMAPLVASALAATRQPHANPAEKKNVLSDHGANYPLW